MVAKETSFSLCYKFFLLSKFYLCILAPKLNGATHVLPDL